MRPFDVIGSIGATAGTVSRCEQRKIGVPSTVPGTWA